MGASTYVPHPDCTEQDKAWLYHNKDGYGFYCNKCGGKGFTPHGIRTLAEWKLIQQAEEEITNAQIPTLPRDFTLDIPDQGLVWLLAAGINSEEAAHHCFGWSERLQRVIMPLYSGRKLLYYQARSIDGRNPKYVNPKVAKEKVAFTVEESDTSLPIVVCEDILSTVRVSNIMQSFSPLGTKLSDWAACRLGRHPRVYIWLDGDEAGRKGRVRMRKQLLWFTEVTLIITDLDPKSYSDAEIKEIIDNASNK